MDYNAPPPDDESIPGIVAGLIERAASDRASERALAMEELYELAHKIGPQMADAIPTMIGGLADPDPKVGERALWALCYCKPHSIEPLIECLAHPAAQVREHAAHSLGNIGDVAREGAPALRQCLADAEQTVRSRAAWALGLVHDAQPATVELLVAMVAGGTPHDRHAALHALGNLGKAEHGAELLVPHRALIVAALDDHDDHVRRWALYALEALPGDAQATADMMVSLLRRDPSSEVREAALSRLKRLTPMVNLAGSEAALLRSLDHSIREASLACDVLATMRPRPSGVLSRLQQALNQDDLVISAATALWKIESRAELIIPALERCFEDRGESVCDLICEMGPAAAPLLPKLVEALSTDDWDLQWAAADALGAMASSDTRVVATLLGALSHPSPIVRSSTARALAKAGAVAVPLLEALVADRAEPRAPWAAYALGEMGPEATQALGALRAGMRDGDGALASCCAIAVALVAGTIDAMPYLIDVLRNDSADSPRRAAAAALGHLGPAAHDAVPALAALADDDDVDLQYAVAQALAVIQGAAQ